MPLKRSSWEFEKFPSQNRKCSPSGRKTGQRWVSSCLERAFHREATLIQICDTSVLRNQTHTRKPEQWLNVEARIQAGTPFGAIAHYRLLWGDIYDFGYHGTKRQWLVDTVRAALARQ